jgi:pyruvate/2-oxoglutarate dehydrogenase complex dihydrolipoamide dehydrogenase (E3) component
MEIYDIAIIGGGTAGLVSGFLAKELGANTVLIERARVGGECLWTGCVPSKTLLKTARVFDTVKRASEFGIHLEKPRLVWSAVKLRLADVQDDIRALEKREIAKSGLEIIRGEASFLDANTLKINGSDGQQIISAKGFILATGSRNIVPPIDGLQETGFLTNQTIFDIPSVPRSLLIVGGGPVACEMAQAFARFGSKVTILQNGARLLPRDDADISVEAQRVLAQEGIEVFCNVEVLRAGVIETKKWLEFRVGKGETQRIEGSEIFVAVGKVADVSALGLENAGVKHDEKTVEVDAYLRTSAKNIWACGDVCGLFQFTHFAEHAAKVAVQNALLPLKKKLDSRVVPWTTFLDPEVAHVGSNEDEACRDHPNCRVFRVPFSELDRAIIEGEARGFLKVVTSDSGRILGAHIIGPGAGEIIHAFVPAVRDGMLLSEFAETIHVYPTLSEISHRAGNEWYREVLERKIVRRALDFMVGKPE